MRVANLPKAGPMMLATDTRRASNVDGANPHNTSEVNMGIYLRAAARTDVGRVRRRNEDAFIVADLTGDAHSIMPRWTGRLEIGARGALIAVSDGMGGAHAGDVASAMVIASLARALASEPPRQTSLAQITDAVQDAHHTVWSEGSSRGIQMGATLTAVYVRGVSAYVAEVGDSRAYLLRAGCITQLTKDQSYVQMLLDSGAVDPDQAQSLPFRNIILQAMGHQPNVVVALGRLELRHRDCLLLCSDGLSNELSDSDIQEVFCASPDIVSAADNLVDLANQRGGRDNATVVLAGVGGDLPAPSVREPVGNTYRIIESFEH
jgi:serine/threonine protein phosphatase PrpC